MVREFLQSNEKTFGYVSQKKRLENLQAMDQEEDQRSRSRSPRVLLSDDQKHWRRHFGTINLNKWRIFTIDGKVDYFYVGESVENKEDVIKRLMKDRYYYWPSEHDEKDLAFIRDPNSDLKLDKRISNIPAWEITLVKTRGTSCDLSSISILVSGK